MTVVLATGLICGRIARSAWPHCSRLVGQNLSRGISRTARPAEHPRIDPFPLPRWKRTRFGAPSPAEIYRHGFELRQHSSPVRHGPAGSAGRSRAVRFRQYRQAPLRALPRCLDEHHRVSGPRSHSRGAEFAEGLPLGATALLCAAVDGVTAWMLLAVALTFVSPIGGGKE